jgi:hypothetical protein
MSIQEEMKKEDRSLPGRDIMERIRDGRSSILTKLKQFNPRDFMRTSDSTSTDHSTSDPDFQ